MAEQPGATERGSSDPHLPVSSISGPEGPRSRNIWRDGLWIGAAAFLIITLGALYQTWLHLGPQGQQKRLELQGDGQNVPSYGFDLSQLADGINPNEIHVTNWLRNEVPVLMNPGHITTSQNAELTGHEKYVLPTDRVIGVYNNGEARAYPIQVMQVHQLANDELGNETIVVCYDPLVDTANAWEILDSQTISSTSPTYHFALSGLQYKGRSLAYDLDGEREGSPSLWDLASGQAVSGPLTGTMLHKDEVLRCKVMQWRDWFAQHRDTTIVSRDENLLQQYKKDIYGAQQLDDDLPAPVVPQANPDELKKTGLRAKSRGIGFVGFQNVGSPSAEKTLPIFIPAESVCQLTSVTNGVGQYDLEFPGGNYLLGCRKRDVGFTPETLWIVAASGPANPSLVPATMFFTWYATHPDTLVLQADGELVKP